MELLIAILVIIAIIVLPNIVIVPQAFLKVKKFFSKITKNYLDRRSQRCYYRVMKLL